MNLGVLHSRGHLVRIDLFRGSSLAFSSSSSSVAGRLDLECSHHEPLLLSHKISWKRLQEPANSVRLEEFNHAVRRSDHMASSAPHGGERKRKAGISIQVSATPEKTGQVVFGGVPAARSGNVVDADDRKAADIGGDRPLTACSARPGEFDNTFRSDHMSSAADVGGGDQDKKATSVRSFKVMAYFSREARDAANRRERAPGRRETLAGEEAASASARSTSNGAIRSPSRSATAPPADNISGEDNRIMPTIEVRGQVPAPGSGKVRGGDQETGPSPKRVPSSHSHHTNPDKAAVPSSAAAHDSDGGVSSYELGLAATLAMDDEAIKSAVAKHIGLEPHQEQRPQRRAVRQRKAAAAAAKAVPLQFSLRLSDEEAMEDVAAVSVPKDDVNPEAKAPVGYGKRRRG